MKYFKCFYYFYRSQLQADLTSFITINWQIFRSAMGNFTHHTWRKRLRGKSSALRLSATSSGSILSMVLAKAPRTHVSRGHEVSLRIVVLQHVLLAGCAPRSVFRIGIGFGFSSLVDVRAARTCW